MTTTSTSDELRQKHRQQRAKLPTDTQAEHAAALSTRLLSLPSVQQANHVAAYIAIRGEISLTSVMAQLSESGKQIYLPVLRGQAMHFSPWKPSQPLLKKGFGLLEPDTPQSEWIPPKELDLVLAPLVVFDKECNRIGQGGGFYDRTFAFRHGTSATPSLLGVAHEDQREPQLPVEHWDVPLDMIATNQTLYTR